MRRPVRRQLWGVPNDLPISEVNTTPLIDVMLVLLIMFIMTVPIATHKVALELPGPGGERTEPPIVHRLDLDAAGRLAWDGVAIDGAELGPRLAAVRAEPRAELHFRAAATTRYEDFDRVLASVKDAGITRLGLVDNAQYAQFGR